MKHLHPFLIYVSIVLLCLWSCSKDEETKDENVTQLPDDVTQLYIESGDTAKDTVIIYATGGPNYKMQTGVFNDLNLSRYHEVYTHQISTYNPDIILELKENLTYERAKKESDLSVEIIRRVANHFKDQGKQVYLIGHSIGAFLLTAHSVKFFDDDFRYMIMAGRLDMPDKVWKGFRDRQGYKFEDGITPTPQEPKKGTKEIEIKQAYAGMRLQAAIAEPRYTQLLKGKDLSKSVYVYGEKDKNVGRLTEDEVSFLKDHRAKVYVVKDGGHGDMFDSPHSENIVKILFNIK